MYERKKMSWQEVEQTISKYGSKDQLFSFAFMGLTGIALMKGKASAQTSILTLGGAYLASNMLAANLFGTFNE